MSRAKKGRPRTDRPCIDCGIPTAAELGRCRQCRVLFTADPRKPCLMCDSTTEEPDRHCKACRRHLNEAAAHVDLDIDGLGPGEWVAVRGVRRWVPSEAEVEPDEADYDEAGLRMARAAYKDGDRTPWARVGQRLYCRRTQARKAVA